MPYKVEKRGNKFATVSKITGKVKGIHETKEKAMAQMRLLYGVEGGMKPREKKVAGRKKVSTDTGHMMVKV